MPAVEPAEPPPTGAPGAVPSVAQPAAATARIMRIRAFTWFPLRRWPGSDVANYVVTTLT
jgi:hypothetical protein